MGRVGIALMVLSLVAIPAYSATVFVKGNGQVAMLAKANLRKDTSYKVSNKADHTILEVRQETWSHHFLSPPTTAISMKLLSAKGRLLWSKTEPVGSRTTASVVQDLLKDLAKAKPKVR